MDRTFSKDVVDNEGFESDQGVEVTLNLRCLEPLTWARAQDRFTYLADQIARAGDDALALQEVCSTPELDALAYLEAQLEAETGEAWSSAYVFAHIGWEGTPEEADEGLALLVKGELSEPFEVLTCGDDLDLHLCPPVDVYDLAAGHRRPIRQQQTDHACHRVGVTDVPRQRCAL